MKHFPVMPAAEFEQRFPELQQEIIKELGVGFVPNIVRCIMNISPRILQHSWDTLRNNLYRCSLHRSTSDMIFSYVSYKRSCEYCHIAHQALAIRHGFDEEEYQILMRDKSKIKSPVLRSVIEFTDLAAINNFNDIHGSFSQMTDLGLSKIEIAEVVSIISTGLYMVNLANSLSIDVDHGFREIIKKAAS